MRSWFLSIAALCFCLPLTAQVFEDDFNRPDGPIDGWEVNAGDWNLADGALEAGPATGGGQAGEQQVFAGDPAETMPENATFAFNWEFLAPGDEQPVGRHAGCYFAWNTPGVRWAAETSGYQLWWIDREADRGLNLAVWEGTAFRVLQAGTGDLFFDPPETIEIQFDGSFIQVFGDGVLAIEAEDTTFRSGLFALWTWDGAGQHVRFDDLEIEGEFAPIVPCLTVTPERPTVNDTVTFDSSCTVWRDGVPELMTWDFGDGETAVGETVEHRYEFADTYTVTLELLDDADNRITIEATVSVSETVCPFEDDFDDLPAGELVENDWTYSPTTPGLWSITEDGKLEGQSAGEAQLWRGVPAGLCGGEELTIDFTIEFLNHVGCNRGPVGKHAGIHFFAEEPTHRTATPTYGLWWIDRDQDFGMGLHRWNGPGLTQLANTRDTAPDLCEPPLQWTILIEGPRIRCYGDGRLLIDVEDDALPRAGYIGPWAYLNEQLVHFDDFSVRTGLFPPDVTDPIPCARVAPPSGPAGEEFVFDASCTALPEGVEATTYRWDFGDGASGEGLSVSHAYEFGGVYTVLLEIELSRGEPIATELEVAVFEPPELPIFEDFELPAGEVTGWTTDGGEWEITPEGQLFGRGAGAETHIWLGDPPVRLSGDLTIEFTIEWLSPQADAVGRHGGVFFYADEPVSRWQNAAYDVWWIDRPQDQGLGLHRWPLTILSPGTGIELPELGLVDPPERWRVEIDGPTIRVYGDDELLVERQDETRRDGFFGFWLYSNNNEVLIDNLCIVEGPFEGSPDCTGTGGLRPCFEVTGEDVGDGSFRFPEELAFDASCTRLPPDPVALDYLWDFGDGGTAEGQSVTHRYDAPGDYRVTLRVEDPGGNGEETGRTVRVREVTDFFYETFDDPGVLENFTLEGGDWTVNEGGELVVETVDEEAYAWIGNPPIQFSGDLDISFSMVFENHSPEPTDVVGKHAGFFFYAENPAARWGNSAYDVWWIDREQDFGPGIHGWNGGQVSILADAPGLFLPFDPPPEEWRIEIRGPTIRLFGDGELLAEAEDDARRSGYLGFWSYLNGQRIRFDELCVHAPGEICEGPPPESFIRGDADSTGGVNITDGIYLLNFLFLGGPAPECADSGDADDSGATNITDGIYILNFLFLGGTAPPAPYPDCGPDPSADALDCAGSAACF